MLFEAALIKTPDDNDFLKANCTRVRDDYWIYEGFMEILDDELQQHEVVAEGIIPSIGGLSEQELVDGCADWFDRNLPA